MTEPLPHVVAVVGPTAAGKSKLGVAIAQRLKLPVLVCDSVKVYRRLDIGSAKPSAEQRAKVPHHLIDLANPDGVFSAGDYARAAWSQLDATGGVLVGGTGFYLRATAWTHSADDLFVPDVSFQDPERQAFETHWMANEAKQAGACHSALTAIDPETAESIHPNNLVRLIRALWMCERLGRPVSAIRRENPPQPRMRLLVLVCDPGPALEDMIRARLARMFEHGWLQEVEQLVADGYDERHKAMRSLGYKQLVDVVKGRVDLSTARESIAIATRQYAKRQRTFVRHQLVGSTVQLMHVASVQDCPWDRVAAFAAGGSLR